MSTHAAAVADAGNRILVDAVRVVADVQEEDRETITAVVEERMEEITVREEVVIVMAMAQEIITAMAMAEGLMQGVGSLRSGISLLVYLFTGLLVYLIISIYIIIRSIGLDPVLFCFVD